MKASRSVCGPPAAACCAAPPGRHSRSTATSSDHQACDGMTDLRSQCFPAARLGTDHRFTYGGDRAEVPRPQNTVTRPDARLEAQPLELLAHIEGQPDVAREQVAQRARHALVPGGSDRRTPPGCRARPSTTCRPARSAGRSARRTRRASSSRVAAVPAREERVVVATLEVLGVELQPVAEVDDQVGAEVVGAVRVAVRALLLAPVAEDADAPLLERPGQAVARRSCRLSRSKLSSRRPCSMPLPLTS